MKWLYWLLFIPSFAHALCGEIENMQEKQSCAMKAYKQVDGELNQVYTAIRKDLNQEQKQKLKNAQVAWIAFRDADCAHQVSKSTENHIITKYTCLTRMTQLRTGELQYIYSNLFIGYTPIDYSAAYAITNKALSQQKLIGRWKSQADEYGVILNFQVVEDEATFSSTLNGQQFETGSWQFTDGQLMITNEQGEILYLYNQASLENNVLTLYEKEGGIETYHRIQD